MQRFQIPLFDMLLSVSSALDLISSSVVNHHKRVAYTAFWIAEELGFPRRDKEDIIVAGMLHDSGALTRKERLDALEFELERPYEHAEIGYALLK